MGIGRETDGRVDGVQTSNRCHSTCSYKSRSHLRMPSLAERGISVKTTVQITVLGIRDPGNEVDFLSDSY